MLLFLEPGGHLDPMSNFMCMHGAVRRSCVRTPAEGLKVSCFCFFCHTPTISVCLPHPGRTSYLKEAHEFAILAGDGSTVKFHNSSRYCMVL